VARAEAGVVGQLGQQLDRARYDAQAVAVLTERAQRLAAGRGHGVLAGDRHHGQQVGQVVVVPGQGAHAAASSGAGPSYHSASP